MQTRSHNLRFTATALIVAALAVVGQNAPASAAERPIVTQPRSFEAPDPVDDVTATGDLTGLLGPQDVYDAVDLTGVKAEAIGSTAPGAAYVLTATTVGAFTGGSDVLPVLLNSEVIYTVSWRTVSRRGVVAELPETITVSASADGVSVERSSLPPRCRNAVDLVIKQEAAPGDNAGDSAGLLTISVPRTCAKGTSGIPSGVAGLRVVAQADFPGGSVFGSYRDEAAADGVAVFPAGPRV